MRRAPPARSRTSGISRGFHRLPPRLARPPGARADLSVPDTATDTATATETVMTRIEKSTQRLAEGGGFSLDVSSAGRDEVVQVFKGSVLRGAPVGHAVSTAAGLWLAFGSRRASMAKKELGVFPTVDDAIRAVLLHSEW
ncbi:hypothetical protein K7787_28515 [Streptomyces sp. RCPT1-4]|nr:hypothetical protein [Streptomyces sennicomposti]